MNTVFRRLLVVAVAASAGWSPGLTARAQEPPAPVISDSFAQADDESVDIFFVQKIDGRKVDNALNRTIAKNVDRGMRVNPEGWLRNVATTPTSFLIVGTKHYAAPILALAQKTRWVSGVVNFTPAPGHHYTVKGVVYGYYQAVWIEDEDGSVVDRKIEAGHRPDD